MEGLGAFGSVSVCASLRPGLSLCFPQTFVDSRSPQQPCPLLPSSLGGGGQAQAPRRPCWAFWGQRAPSAAPPHRPARLPGWKWAGPAGPLRVWTALGPRGLGLCGGPLPSQATFQRLDVHRLKGPPSAALVGPCPSGHSPELRVGAQTSGGISGAREAGTVGPSGLGPRGQCAGPGLDAHERASQPCWTSGGPGSQRRPGRRAWVPPSPDALTRTLKREACTSSYAGALEGPWGSSGFPFCGARAEVLSPERPDVPPGHSQTSSSASPSQPRSLRRPGRNPGHPRVPLTVTGVRAQKVQAGPGQSPQGLVVSAQGTRDKPTISMGSREGCPSTRSSGVCPGPPAAAPAGLVRLFFGFSFVSFFWEFRFQLVILKTRM